jgi:hypothetical protein
VHNGVKLWVCLQPHLQFLSLSITVHHIDKLTLSLGKLFGNKEMRILMLGLDAAGKTSELMSLFRRVDEIGIVEVRVWDNHVGRFIVHFEVGIQGTLVKLVSRLCTFSAMVYTPGAWTHTKILPNDCSILSFFFHFIPLRTELLHIFTY